MIRKVHRITSFGVFNDFTWPNSLHEFKQFNLIFGWNYSGKTTFSRTFRCFELLKCHTDFDKAEVHLHCEDGRVHSLSTTTGPHHYRVFNVDFVRDNIRFDEGTAEPILILGSTDIAKQVQLQEKQGLLTLLQSEIYNSTKVLGEVETSLDRASIVVARDNIKVPFNRLNYDKSKLMVKVEACKTDPAKNILSDLDCIKVLQSFNSIEKKASMPDIPHNAFASLSTLTTRVAEISSRSVKSITIQAMVDKPELEKWLSEGRALHEGEAACQFCGGRLPENLLLRLADHFSTEYDNLISDVVTLERDLNKAITEAPRLPQSGFFYTDQSIKLDLIARELDDLFKIRQTSIDLLLKAVQNKKVNAFTSFSGPAVTDNTGKISKSLADIALLINEHNERSQQFDQTREAAFIKLEAHWASRFVLDQSYVAKTQQIKELKNELTDKSAKKRELVDEIKRIERELSEATKGAGTINDLMRTYFGKDDLQIVASEDKRFRITRNGFTAKNLSEGERSAIAFVYFMTRLLDEKISIAKTTVVIDDPIGSLDANHLFNTYSFLKIKLAECYQLFILTHNYEFYSLFKEWALSVSGNEVDKPQMNWKRWSIYLVRRKDNGTSTIEVIPPELLKFKSEYHYLFATLLKFQSAVDINYDYLFSLPNVARRFMEAFGGIMIPTHQGLYPKLPRLIPDDVQRERVWKFINNYSHNTSLNRSLVIPDISECKVVIAVCLYAVKQWNEAYYEDLVNSIR